jgi:hypothetical protein
MSGNPSRFAFAILAGLLVASIALAQDAVALREREAALRDQLAKNPFQRPLVLESTGSNGVLKGDVSAVVGQPFETVGKALPSMDGWCDILMLQTNVKNCSARGTGSSGVLSVAIARKFDQSLAEAHRVDFNYRIAAATPDYLAVHLGADSGPLGTKNYRIVLEATPLDAKRSFLRMSYSYGYGVAGRVAMQTYLATTGRDKVGFTLVERSADGTPVYVGGERGMIERNTMRNYLAIEAYLGAYGLPPAAQQEKRLNDWFAAVERYPRQLREDIGREGYLSMKRRELARQQTAAAG